MDTSLRRRKSAKAASDAIAGQLDSDALSGNSGVSDGEQRRPVVKQRYGKRTKMQRKSNSGKDGPEPVNLKTLDSRSQSPAKDIPLNNPLISLEASTSQSTEPLRARASSILSDLDDLSDLTSLSSDESSALNPTVTKGKGARKPRSTVAPKASAPKSTKVKGAPRWKEPNVGSYVWVLIQPETHRVYDEGKHKDDGVERVWWPGKVKVRSAPNLPLKVTLFGDKSNVVDIYRPSKANVASQSTPLSKLRFKTLACSPPRKESAEEEDGTNSSRKKQKIVQDDLHQSWDAAVSAMKVDAKAKPFPPVKSKFDSLILSPGSDNESDDLPEYFDLLNQPAPLSSKQSPPKAVTSSHARTNSSTFSKGGASKPGKRKRTEKSDMSADEFDVNKKDRKDDYWTPPGPDIMLEIPGELVFAREGEKTSLYWPARIEKYEYPSNKKQEGKYTVTWVDGKVQNNILRSWIAYSEDDNFTTCKLGQFSSTIVEVQNDEENENNIYNEHQGSRSPSPERLDPPPSAEEFCLLNIRQQFAYVKPILKAIIEDRYPPIRERHEKFMKGGRYRQDTVDLASLRGRVDPRDVERLQEIIRKVFADTGREQQQQNPQPLVNVVDGLTESPSKDEPATEDHDMQFASPPLTPRLLSSPAQTPPSSLPVSTAEPSLSFASDTAPEPGLDVDVSTIHETRPEQEHRLMTFNSLSPMVKVDYCLNILLPEALRQILLWRFEERTTTDLLSSEKEEELYQKGQILLQERDWVRDIMRLREAKQKSKSQHPSQSKALQKDDSMSGRSRRNRSFVNYQE